METRTVKHWSISPNCPQKNLMMILNSWSIPRKIFITVSDLSKVASTLLKLLPEMENFLKTFQEFNKNNFL